MAQRTVFPSIPNTAEAHYPGVVQSIFAELNRAGGRIPFKTFRQWMKERNIYNKEDAEDLLNFLGCEARPEVVLGSFGRQMLECDTPEAQGRLLYRWVNAWNPFLTKYVFEAIDVEGGGRLHSTHELYRMITSYVYAGEYVTLPNFQSWIRWMAASGYIKYIGIRWGLSEVGRQEMPAIRQIDVDELLEEEEEDARAEDASPHLPEFGSPEPTPPASGATAAPAPAAIPTGEASPDADVVESPEEDVPDMPPEAPVPEWTPPEGEEQPAVAEAAAPAPRPASRPAPARAAGSAAAAPAWFAAAPQGGAETAADLGITTADYEQSPAIFLFRLATAAGLATGGAPASAWRPFFGWLEEQRVFQRYLADERPLEEILDQAGWLESSPGHRALFGWVALDLMRLRRVLTQDPNLPGTLAGATDGERLMLLHEKLFQGALTAAPYWLLREARALGVWSG